MQRRLHTLVTEPFRRRAQSCARSVLPTVLTACLVGVTLTSLSAQSLEPSMARPAGTQILDAATTADGVPLDPEALRCLRVPPRSVRANVRRLTRELDWERSVASALRSAKDTGRPVFLVQALGDLDGFT